MGKLSTYKATEAAISAVDYKEKRSQITMPSGPPENYAESTRRLVRKGELSAR